MNWKDERNFRNIILSAVLTAILFFCLLFYSLFVMEKRYERYENAALGLIIQEYGNPDNQFINRLLSLNETGAESEGRNYFNDHGYEITRSLVMLDRIKKMFYFHVWAYSLAPAFFFLLPEENYAIFIEASRTSV